MKRLYVDTNIFSLADKKKLVLSVNSLTFANTHYILSKLKSVRESFLVLRRFRLLTQVLPLNDKIIDLALNNESFKDFEDGLQYYSALENEQDIIITRDVSGFKESKIPVMTPEEFLSSI